ncbi:MAG: DEAD/DEAH box helicase, partial [Tomitella sp.]|nr:DEAD/DEAH box helicase [Tomitella sp.]
MTATLPAPPPGLSVGGAPAAAAGPPSTATTLCRGTSIAAAPTEAQAARVAGVDLSVPTAPDTRSAAAVLDAPGIGEPLLFDGLLDSLRGVPLDDLDGVGDKTLTRLTAGGIGSVYDLLMRIPLRYVDRTRLVPLQDLRAGQKQVTFLARVVSKTTNWEKRYARFVLGDKHVRVGAMFFNATWMGKRFTRGDLLIVQGDVGDFNGMLSMTAPLLEPLQDASAPLLSIYPQSQKHQVDTWMLRRAAVDALRRLPSLADPLPAPLIAKRRLPTRLAALRAVHVPETKQQADEGHDRLAYDELLRMQLALGVLRNAQAAEPGVHHAPTGRLLDAWLTSLPYRPTGAQTRTIGEIRADMAAGRPMNRLLQGDVGSGKTLVLSAAALMAIEGGYQAALLAPTEILARQHFEEMSNALRPLGVAVDLLVSKNLPRKRRDVLTDLADGTTHLVVGTHSLLSEHVVYHRLGIALIDEQHRFGVDQRATLAEKGPGGTTPDILQAPATPIPRTAAISTYGDLA